MPPQESGFRLKGLTAVALASNLVVLMSSACIQGPAVNEGAPASTAADASAPATHAGSYAGHEVTGLEQGGRWVAMFTPPLPPTDDALLGAAGYVLRDLMGVTRSSNPPYTLDGQVIRFATDQGDYDMVFVKNDDRTIHSMTFIKH